MNSVINILTKLGILKDDLRLPLNSRIDNHPIFVLWISEMVRVRSADIDSIHQQRPAYFLMYPVFGIRGASWFLGVSEWLFCALLFAGFSNKKLGILGALGSVASFVATVTIIPFMPDGWAASAGGFPAMTGNIPFLMKDVVLLAVSFYLLKQDVMRVSLSVKRVAPDRLERVGQQREHAA